MVRKVKKREAAARVKGEREGEDRVVCVEVVGLRQRGRKGRREQVGV